MPEMNSLYDPARQEADQAPFITAYYYKQWDDFRMSFHSHDSVEIMYVISGDCIVETEREVIALRKGDFVLLDAGVRHRLLVDKGRPCRMLNAEFGFADVGIGYPSVRALAADSPALTTLLAAAEPAIVLRDPHDVYQSLRGLVTELDSGYTERSSMAQLLLGQLLVQIARLAQLKRGGAEAQTSRYVREAAEYIRQHYDTDLEVKEVADAVHLHPTYLQRIFKAGMGRTLVDYLTETRMEKAKMLLARTDIPITQIADYVGLNSRQYFSMLFRKMVGITPIEYRRRAEASFYPSSVFENGQQEAESDSE
jgi:AraC-like DNA-binding protein